MRMSRLVVIAGLLVSVLAHAADRSSRISPWQRIVEKVRAPAPPSSSLVHNECLGDLPSPSAQSHILSYYQNLTQGPLTHGRVRVVDPDQKLYCILLKQYWGEWTIPIPRDQIPLQYQATAPSEYHYVSPLAQCVPRVRVEWCDEFVGRWKTEPNHELDALALMSIYESSCGRGDCPFVDAHDHVQADYYLLDLIGRKLRSEAVR